MCSRGIIVVNRTPAKQKESEKTSSIDNGKRLKRRTVLFFFYVEKDNRLGVTKKDTKSILLGRTCYESTLHGVNCTNHSFLIGAIYAIGQTKRKEIICRYL